MLRKLEALLLPQMKIHLFIITGNGDVVQPENDLILSVLVAFYAQAAARAMLENTEPLHEKLLKST